MKLSHRTKIVVAAAGIVAVVAAGAAIAATRLTPEQESKAIIDDAANQLGIEPSRLSEALKTALKNRVDEAVEQGRLTRAEGEALKDRIDAGEYPLIFGPRGPGFRHDRPGPHRHFFHHDLSEAATYLGMTEAELREALDGEKTLAQIARDRGKSVDGLVDALVKGHAERLDRAVAEGRLTDEERDEVLADLRQRVTDFVNGRRGPLFRRGPRREREAFIPTF